MSYRVLFAQDKRSRQLFRSAHPRTCGIDGVEDPMLQEICGRKAINLPGSLNARVRLRRVYSCCDDFPLLGDRLKHLQLFNSRHEANTLQEFWQDRRNPFNFYTFWAVIVIGGISIALSAIQCALSGAQLAEAIRQNPQTT